MDSHPVDMHQNVEQVARIEAAELEVAGAAPQEMQTGRLWIVVDSGPPSLGPVCLS